MRQSKTISSESGCDGNKAFQNKLTHRVHWQHFEDIQSIELHAFGHASGKGVSSVVYAVVRQLPDVSQGLVAGESKIGKTRIDNSAPQACVSSYGSQSSWKCPKGSQRISCNRITRMAGQHRCPSLDKWRWKFQAVRRESSDQNQIQHPA